MKIFQISASHTVTFPCIDLEQFDYLARKLMWTQELNNEEMPFEIF